MSQEPGTVDAAVETTPTVADQDWSSWRNDKLLPLTIILALLLVFVSCALAFVLIRNRKRRQEHACQAGWRPLPDVEAAPSHHTETRYPIYHAPRPIRPVVRPAFNKRDFLPPFSMFRSGGEKFWHSNEKNEKTNNIQPQPFFPEEAGMRDCACCRHDHTGHVSDGFNYAGWQAKVNMDEKKTDQEEKQLEFVEPEVRWEEIRDRGEVDLEITEIRLSHDGTESPPKSPPPVYTVLR